ncbi:MAG: hypothetical protein R2727_06735 [Bacteroidales bacterium]
MAYGLERCLYPWFWRWKRYRSIAERAILNETSRTFQRQDSLFVGRYYAMECVTKDGKKGERGIRPPCRSGREDTNILEAVGFFIQRSTDEFIRPVVVVDNVFLSKQEKARVTSSSISETTGAGYYSPYTEDIQNTDTKTLNLHCTMTPHDATFRGLNDLSKKDNVQ